MVSQADILRRQQALARTTRTASLREQQRVLRGQKAVEKKRVQQLPGQKTQFEIKRKTQISDLEKFKQQIKTARNKDVLPTRVTDIMLYDYEKRDSLRRKQIEYIDKALASVSEGGLLSQSITTIKKDALEYATSSKEYQQAVQQKRIELREQQQEAQKERAETNS